MSKHAKRYTDEFRQRMVELVRAGRRYSELEREFQVSDFTIRKWVRDSNIENNPIQLSEQEELKQLRREVKILREEKEILKKAAAWFAQETATLPNKRSK